MRATITPVLPASAEKVWERVKRPDTLRYITRGALGFSGSQNFPERWTEGTTVETRLLFFGVIPAWKHRIRVQRLDETERVIFTHEGGGLVRTWNHFISVVPLDRTTTRYTDQIDIEAGPLTPLVWGFAHVFYRYRQLRWKRLLTRDQAPSRPRTG